MCAGRGDYKKEKKEYTKETKQEQLYFFFNICFFEFSKWEVKSRTKVNKMTNSNKKHEKLKQTIFGQGWVGVKTKKKKN